MRFVISLFLLIVLSGVLFADEKARFRASWQWATACQSATCQTEVKQAIKTEDQTVVEKNVQTETISYGTCSSGSCQTASASSRFSLFRRRR